MAYEVRLVGVELLKRGGVRMDFAEGEFGALPAGAVTGSLEFASADDFEDAVTDARVALFNAMRFLPLLEAQANNPFNQEALLAASGRWVYDQSPDLFGVRKA